MRTDAHDPARVRDPTIELLLSHTATLPRFGDLRAARTHRTVSQGSAGRTARAWATTPSARSPGRDRRNR